MLTVNHHCKFCGADVILEIDEDALKMMNLEKWKGMAACNRCADFMSYRYKAYEEIRLAALSWHLCKPKNLTEEARRHAAERKAELLLKIEKLLKDWLEVMNEYFRVHLEWDSSVMNSFVERRVPIATILNSCQRMMRQQTRIEGLRIGRAAFPIA